MTKEEAAQILSGVLRQVQTNFDNHLKLQEALQTLAQEAGVYTPPVVTEAEPNTDDPG